MYISELPIPPSTVIHSGFNFHKQSSKMAPHSQPVEEVFEPEYQRVHQFSAERAASLVHARRWDAKVDRQITIAHELSRLASDEYLEDIMQHARHMEVRSLAAHPINAGSSHQPWDFH